MRRNRWSVGAVLCGLLFCAAAAQARVRLGGVFVSGGYSHFSGPYYPYGYGWYGPFGYDPFFYSPYFLSPYYSTGFARGPNMGEVRLRTDRRQAEVFLDGAYAGTVGELKHIWLQPGAYNLEIRENDASYTRRIYVLSGKSVRIEPQFRPRVETKP